MKTINLYLVRNVLLALIIAVAAGTFVMLIGQLAKIFDLLSRGISLRTLLLFTVYRIPSTAEYTIPLGLFIATVLVFHRMSLDHEITALRSSGLSLGQIIGPLVLLSLTLSIVCFLVQFIFAPEFLYRAKNLVREAGIQNPLNLVEDGRFVEMFDGYIIYVGRKDGQQLSDIHLYVLNRDDKVRQKIDAERGTIAVNESLKQLELTLDNATIESVDPDRPADVSAIRRVRGESCSIALAYGDAIQNRSLVRGVAEMRLSQLFARIQIQSERGIDNLPLYLELHVRAALALSPFSFILVAVPLGIRMPRKDSTYSLLGSIIVPIAYFVFMAFIQTLRHSPQYHPEFLLWAPNITFQAAGLFGLWMKR